jgi:prepilin-type N-terminal cleavage/methylation domain-containing protein
MMRNQHNGFTLIELLIAITILSLLLLTASFSYGLISDRWNKELGQFSASARVAKHLELTQKLLEGIQSYIVVDNTKKPFFFFIGHQNSLLAVSQAGFFSGDYPEIFRLTAVEKSTGLFDLIYQSTSSEDVLLLGIEQDINFTRSLVLFTDLEQVSFSYYGWQHMHQKTDDEGRGYQANWTNNYSGIDSQYMPSKLTLNIINKGQSLLIPIELQTDVEKWLSPYFNSDT